MAGFVYGNAGLPTCMQLLLCTGPFSIPYHWPWGAETPLPTQMHVGLSGPNIILGIEKSVCDIWIR